LNSGFSKYWQGATDFIIEKQGNRVDKKRAREQWEIGLEINGF
jgi:hypothetical protein